MTETAYAGSPAGPGPRELTSDEKTMAMLAHLMSFAACFIPLGNVLGPLVIWLLKKDTSPFVDAHGKESLNFQITWMIYYMVSAVLTLVIIGIFLLLALAIAQIVLAIIAAVAANSGKSYRYPLTLRLIS